MKKLLLLLMLLPFFGNSQEWLKEKTLTDWRAYTHSFRPDTANLMDVEGVRLTKAYYYMAEQNEMAESIQFGFLGEAAIKTRDVGVDSYIEKLYDLSVTGDGTQTTEASQPYLTGNIAPSERKGIKNPNGDGRYITHPEISFSATDDWSITTVLNNNYDGSSSDNNAVAGNTITANNYNRYILQPIAGHLTIINSDNSNSYLISGGYNSSNLGKNTVVTIVYNGASITVYNNGLSTGTIAATNASLSLNAFFYGKQASLQERQLKGTINAHIIRNIALTPTQVAAEAEWLQTVYPEIPSVTIGTQDWATSNFDAVATPQGNVIPNVTLAATWATSQTLYDDYLTANPGDTYGATQAASMWCYYDNDSQLGAVYGKLYNWFAVSLIQQDIDLYNAANPTAHWGYHVPSQAEFTTLQTYLGGSTVAGGKMKKDGLDYWTTPNTGATNWSGFSALGSGYRIESGVFASINTIARVATYSQSGGGIVIIDIDYNNSQMTIAAQNYARGFSLRLIKD